MLKGRRTKVIILIVTGLLIVFISPLILINIGGNFDEQENNPNYFNSKLFMVSLWTLNPISGSSQDDFDPIDVKSSTFKYLDLDINREYIIPLAILVETSVGILIFNLIKNECQNAVQNVKIASISITLDLSVEESQILAHVEEFLNQNRVYYRHNLVSFIRHSKFQEDNELNHNGIEYMLDSLEAKHIIVEGSKITRNTILSNLNRSSIYEEIKNNPGAYLNVLSKNLGLSIFLTNWHLNILLRFDMIRTQEFSSHIAYFDSELPLENDYILQIISRVKCRRIIDFLKLNSNGRTKSQVAKTLRMHHTTVNKYLEILIDNNLANLRIINNRSIYCLNTEKFDEFKSFR